MKLDRKWTHPSHSGSESLEERLESVHLDRLDSAVDESLVGTLGSSLQARFDDLREVVSFGLGIQKVKRTSGGMAKVHMVTPAAAPATMTAERLNAAGSCPLGVSSFFTNSYATK